MADGIGQFSIEVVPDTRNFAGAVRKQLDSVGKSLQQVGAGLTLGVTAPIAAFAKQSIDAASNLGESINAVNKIFGDSAKEIKNWGKNNATQFGLSQQAFNELAVPLGASLKNAGLSMDDVSSNTINLTKRAADMASVFNVDVEEALTAIQAALRGESDPIERFGVSVNAAAVEQRALADSGKAAASELTDQEKIVARLGLIFDQTKTSAGDFTDTQDSLANAQRRLTATIETVQAKLGAVLLPILEKWVGRILRVAETLSEMNDAQAQFIVQMAAVAAAVGPALVVFGSILRALSSIRAVLAGLTLGTGIGLLIAGMVALAAGFIKAYQSSQPLRDAVAKLLEAFRPLWAAVQPLIAALGTAFAGALTRLTPLFIQLVTSLIPVVQRVTEFVQGLAAGVAPVDRFGRTTTNVFTTVRAVIGNVITQLVRWFGPGGTVQTFLQQNAGFFRQTWNQISGIVRVAAQFVRSIVLAMLNNLRTFWERWGTTILRIVRVIWDTIKEVIRAALNIIRGVITLATNVIRGNWRGVWRSILTILRGIWDLIFAVIRGATRTVIAVLAGMYQQVRRSWDNFWDRTVNKMRNVRDAVVNAARSLRDGVAGAFRAMQSAVAGPVNWIINRVINGGLIRAWNGLMGALGFDNLKVGNVGTISVSGRSGGRGSSGENRYYGGPIKGTPGRDRIPALGPGGVRYWLSDDEHVLTAQEVKAAGGHGAIFALRKALLSATGLRPEELLEVIRTGFVPPTGGDPRFAAGGIVAAKAFARRQHGKPYIWGGVGPRGYDCSGFQSAILNVLEGKAPYSRRFTTGSITTSKSLKSGLGPRQGYSIGAYRGNPGHMAGTLGGVAVESGGSPSLTKYGIGASSASSSRFNLKFHATKGGFDISGILKKVAQPILNSTKSLIRRALHPPFEQLGVAMVDKVDRAVFGEKQIESKVSGGSGGASFQRGTPFVPDDMWAFLHRGEAVIPAAVNRLLRSRANAIGAGGKITIELVGDGSRRADFLIDELRDAIRKRGRNVQDVLGARR